MTTPATLRPLDRARRLLPRVLLLKLLALFFLVHPGSCATFHSRHYLSQRYPNRDVVPATLLHPQSAQQRHRRQAQGGADTTSSLLFIRAPAGLPSSSSSSSSPTKPSSLVARPVVIGSFVSELESNGDRRRTGPRPRFPGQQQQPQQQEGPSSFGPPQRKQVVSLGSIQGGASSSSSGAKVGGLFQKSAATLVDAYDGVLSFVGSRIVTTEATFSKALNAVSHSMMTPLALAMEGDDAQDETEPRIHTMRLSSSSSLQSRSSSPALVGFMDLDPFEKSKRHFKRNTSLAKLLL